MSTRSETVAYGGPSLLVPAVRLPASPNVVSTPLASSIAFLAPASNTPPIRKDQWDLNPCIITSALLSIPRWTSAHKCARVNHAQSRPEIIMVRTSIPHRDERASARRPESTSKNFRYSTAPSPEVRRRTHSQNQVMIACPAEAARSPSLVSTVGVPEANHVVLELRV